MKQLESPEDVSKQILVELNEQARRALYEIHKVRGESYRTIIRQALVNEARRLKGADIPKTMKIIDRKLSKLFNEILSLRRILKEKSQGGLSLGQLMKTFQKFKGRFQGLKEEEKGESKEDEGYEGYERRERREGRGVLPSDLLPSREGKQGEGVKSPDDRATGNGDDSNENKKNKRDE